MTAGPRSERLGVYATLTLSMRLNNSQNDNEESAAAIELNATTRPLLFTIEEPADSPYLRCRIFAPLL